jgi:hypothetical protein
MTKLIGSARVSTLRQSNGRQQADFWPPASGATTFTWITVSWGASFTTRV